jgi:hypothetical protein
VTLDYRPWELFRFAQTRLLPDAPVVLKPVVAAIRSGPPVKVRVVVVEREATPGMDAARFARHRADNLRQALYENGLPFDMLVEPDASAGTVASVAIEVHEVQARVPLVQAP